MSSAGAAVRASPQLSGGLAGALVWVLVFSVDDQVRLVWVDLENTHL